MPTLAPTYVTDALESREVTGADGELEGFVLYEKRTGKTLTPTRCCRTCAWADSKHVRYVPGHGLAYAAPHRLHYTSADRPGPDAPWSVYVEDYASASDDEPIEGTTRKVSTHTTEAEAIVEASRLQVAL